MADADNHPDDSAAPPAGEDLPVEIIEADSHRFLPTRPDVRYVRFTFRDGINLQSTGVSVFWLLPLVLTMGGVFGFILGAVLGAIEVARISCCLGAVLLGTPAIYIYVRFGLELRRTTGSIRKMFTKIYLVLLAAALGALAGALIVAFIGIFCGAAAGGFLGSLVRRSVGAVGLGVLLGSIIGPVILAFVVDRTNALFWGLNGACIGIAFGLAVVALGWDWSKENR